MRCPNCKQRQFKPSRSMNEQLSTLGKLLWVRLRCYRCGTLKTTPRVVWHAHEVLATEVQHDHDTTQEIAAELRPSSQRTERYPAIPLRRAA